MQADLKWIHPHCESTAFPSANRTVRKDSLNVWPCLQGMSRCYSCMERIAKEEREKADLSLPSLMAHFVFEPTTICPYKPVGGSGESAALLHQTIWTCCWTLETLMNRLKMKQIPYDSEIAWTKTPATPSSGGIYITDSNLAALQDLVLKSCWVI